MVGNLIREEAMCSLKVPLVVMLILCALLAACAAPTLLPTVTPVPTATPVLATYTSVPPTFTPTATPTLTPTPTPTPLPLVLTSGAFEAGSVIPERFGFFKENVSPELVWVNVPAGTRSLVLLMEDRNSPFIHWLVYNIPPDVSGLPEGVIQQPQLDDGTSQGLNDNAEIGYVGPFPPPGETHRYAFVLYALDAPLGLGPGALWEQVQVAMEGHILMTAELTGTYLGVEP